MVWDSSARIPSTVMVIPPCFTLSSGHSPNPLFRTEEKPSCSAKDFHRSITSPYRANPNWYSTTLTKTRATKIDATTAVQRGNLRLGLGKDNAGMAGTDGFIADSNSPAKSASARHWGQDSRWRSTSLRWISFNLPAL